MRARAVEINGASIVGDLAASNIRAARVFSIMGIDYCCHADRSLSSAAAAAGTDVAQIADLILGRTHASAVAKPGQLSDAPLVLITEYIIEHHHRLTRALLVDLLEMIDRIMSAHGRDQDHLVNLKGLIEQLARDLVPHMRREEQFLFPYIDMMDRPVAHEQQAVVPVGGSVEYPMQTIRHDHSDDLLLLTQIRELKEAFEKTTKPCGHIARFVATLAELDRDLREHIDLENMNLFPRALAVETALMNKNRQRPG